jgi:RNA polymerase sigma-70 factor (ECF subfamily)
MWEDAEWVSQLLNLLPPAQREAMACIVDGWQPTEVAALLGKTASTIRQNLKLARDRLRQELLQHEDEPKSDASEEPNQGWTG